MEIGAGLGFPGNGNCSWGSPERGEESVGRGLFLREVSEEFFSVLKDELPSFAPLQEFPVGLCTAGRPQSQTEHVDGPWGDGQVQK